MREFFKNLPNIHHFDALVGYFRATGYFKLRPYLSNIAEIRILVGINVDVLLEKYHTIDSNISLILRKQSINLFPH